MHLGTYTVDLGHAISLPFLDPVDKRFQFFIVIPVRLQIVVVDEEFDSLRTIFTGQATSLTHVVQVT